MATRDISSGVVFLALTLFASVAIASPYVPGMSCDEVGGFAAQVIVAKNLGDSEKQQISNMRQSIQGYPETQRALARVISAIYGSPKMRVASPDAVQSAYKRACEVWEGRYIPHRKYVS